MGRTSNRAKASKLNGAVGKKIQLTVDQVCNQTVDSIIDSIFDQQLLIVYGHVEEEVLDLLYGMVLLLDEEGPVENDKEQYQHAFGDFTEPVHAIFSDADTQFSDETKRNAFKFIKHTANTDISFTRKGESERSVQRHEFEQRSLLEIGRSHSHKLESFGFTSSKGNICKQTNSFSFHEFIKCRSSERVRPGSYQRQYVNSSKMDAIPRISESHRQETFLCRWS
jgi:hypothetical protein